MPDLFQVAEAKDRPRNITPIIQGKPHSLLLINAQSAGKDRYVRISNYIGKCEPDVIILSEVKKKPSTLEFLDEMALRGYCDACLCDSNMDSFHSVILRRVSGKSLSIETDSLKTRVSITRLDTDCTRSVYIVGMYAPPYAAKNFSNRRVFFNDLSEKVLKRLSAGRRNIMLVGDFNMVEEKFHEHIPEVALESKPYFDDIRRNNLIDSVRLFYPNIPMYTWVSPQTGDGQRLDHVFSTPSVQKWIKSIRIDDTCRSMDVSDHSAIHVEIELT